MSHQDFVSPITMLLCLTLVALAASSSPAQESKEPSAARAKEMAAMIEDWRAETAALLAKVDAHSDAAEFARRHVDMAQELGVKEDAIAHLKKACEKLREHIREREARHEEHAASEKAKAAQEREAQAKEARAKEAQAKEKSAGANERARLLHAVGEIDPKWPEELERLERASPEEFERQTRELKLMLAHLSKLANAAPVQYELSIENVRLQRKIERQAREVAEHREKGREQEEEMARSELASQVERLFDLRLKLQAHEVESLEDKARNLHDEAKRKRELLHARREHRAELIQERIAELLGAGSIRNW